MARVKSDAKKRIDAPGRAEAASKGKMDAKHNPTVTGTVSHKAKPAGDGAKKKRRSRPGTKALREIEAQQRSVKSLFARSSIERLIREIVQE